MNGRTWFTRPDTTRDPGGPHRGLPGGPRWSPRSSASWTGAKGHQQTRGTASVTCSAAWLIPIAIASTRSLPMSSSSSASWSPTPCVHGTGPITLRVRVIEGSSSVGVQDCGLRRASAPRGGPVPRGWSRDGRGRRAGRATGASGSTVTPGRRSGRSSPCRHRRTARRALLRTAGERDHERLTPLATGQQRPRVSPCRSTHGVPRVRAGRPPCRRSGPRRRTAARPPPRRARSGRR